MSRDPRVRLSRVIQSNMTSEELAVHALAGIEFATLEASQEALSNVAALVEVVTKGPVRTKPVLVSGS